MPPTRKSGKLAPGLPKVTRNAGKGGGQEMLPSRGAMSMLTGGNPVERSLGNYAKLTPSGAGAPGSYAGIMDMGQKGASVVPALSPDDVD
jgi:hypothetical protein